MGMDTPAFDTWFDQEKKENKDFAARWHEYEMFYEQNSEFFGRRYDRVGTRDVARSTDERTLFAALIPALSCLGNTINFVRPFFYEPDRRGNLKQVEHSAEELHALLSIFDSLVLNFYVRNKVSAHVNMHQLYELPIPKLSAAQKKKLADAAAKLLKNPRDVAERAALETFIARELYGLSLEDWKHLTSTFAFGSGDSKAELDEIIRQSLALWTK